MKIIPFIIASKNKTQSLNLIKEMMASAMKAVNLEERNQRRH
jgi:hypothetical protein